MPIQVIKFKNEEQVSKHIKTNTPTLYFSSQTSTVIPFDKIETFLKGDQLVMGDLGSIPAKMEINPQGNLVIRGAVNWKDARTYLNSQGLNIMTAPTEDLALILAGVATSCTGERSFSFGNLRSQVVSLKYIDATGSEQVLNSNNDFSHTSKALKNYQEDFKSYRSFKNAPYPRFERETDLLIGTEGQMGVITEAELKVVENKSVQHLFMLVPKWENDLAQHLDIIEKIQPFRESVILCELIDANSFSYLPEEDRPNQDMDAIFFEVIAEKFDNFYENFLNSLNELKEDLVFEIGANKFHQLRASIPRAVFETNSHMGVIKMGTDVQVEISKFKELMQIYQSFSKVGVKYNLFGHFGDAHLHFNFMPTKELTDICQKEFERLYEEVLELKGSPFAEHGIGFIKQKYIKSFWGDNQRTVFAELKEKYDPKNQFFPTGFMNLES